MKKPEAQQFAWGCITTKQNLMAKILTQKVSLIQKYSYTLEESLKPHINMKT